MAVPNISANKVLEQSLNSRAAVLESSLSADLMAYVGRIYDGVDEKFRDIIESRTDRRERLAIVLGTPGGYIEVAERIVNTTRKHYKEVDFFIPDSAMSAGTVLVMSGDAIYMDYFSVLGPIDPQVQRPDGNGMIPALGYLVQYERLIEKDRQGTLTTAEAQVLIECFDQAELHFFEQAKELTVTLLKRWLAKYKFKNWTTTETRKIVVDDAMRRTRASEIAEMLNDTKRWHSHSRGITMEVLRKELNLHVEDLEDTPDLWRELREYYSILTDYMSKRDHTDVLHGAARYCPISED